MGHLVFVIHKFSFCIENIRKIFRFSILLVMYLPRTVYIVYSVFIVMQNTTLLYFVQCLNILRIDNNAFLQI